MKHMSLRFRLMWAMLALAVIPVATVTIYAVNNTQNSVENEIISANSSRMSWSRQYLGSELEGMQSLYDSLQIDPQFIGNFDNFSNQNYSMRLQAQNNLFGVLSKAFFTHSREIDNLSLYLKSGDTLLSVDFANSGSTSTVDIHNSNWDTMVQGPVYLYFKREHDGIYSYHSINSFDDHALMGGISARISNSVWTEVYSILNPEKDGSVFILDERGTVLYPTPGAETEEIRGAFAQVNLRDAGMQFRSTKDSLFFMQPIDNGLLTVIKTVPVSVVEKSVQQTMMAGLLIGVIAIALAIALSVLISLHITRPIVRLAKNMKQVQIHDFKVAEVQSKDEIGLLEKGYNTMMQRIKQLIEVEYTQNMEVKNAQIRVLQSQINPHFLNNTLQLIGGIALSKDAPDIYAITNVMSKMMRYAMDASTHTVKLSDELNHVQNYIYIQQSRFDGRFRFEFHMDEALQHVAVPKFILQPIVENAFDHGLRHQEGEWMIELIVHRRANRIGIIVRDNGTGMPAKTLANVRVRLRKDTAADEDRAADTDRAAENPAHRGIGLCNIQSRIRLQYGEKYGLRIFSREGVGSMFVLEIPMTLGEGDRYV